MSDGPARSFAAVTPHDTTDFAGGAASALFVDATTTMVTGLTPGGTFDVATAVIGAGKGAFGVSELVSRRWQP